MIIRFTTLLSAALLKDTLIVSIIFSEVLFMISSNLIFKNKKLFSKILSEVNLNNIKSKISLCDFSALTLGISISIFWNLIRYKSILPISYLNESNTIIVTKAEYIQNFLAGIFLQWWNNFLWNKYIYNCFSFLKIKEVRNPINKEKVLYLLSFKISIYSISLIVTTINKFKMVGCIYLGIMGE